MKVKKCLACLLSMVLLISLLAGCNGATSVTDDDVKVVTIWSGEGHSKVLYEKLINEWNETEGKEKKIKINYEVKDNATLSQNISLALQNNQEPEMFAGGDMLAMAENDQILAINELPNGQELIDKYKEHFRKNVNYIGDKVYCLPYKATTHGLIYNKEMFRAAGLVDENGEPTPPKTFAELREYAKKLTNPAKKEYGFIFPLKWNNYWLDIVSANMSNFGYETYNPVKDMYDITTLEPILNTYLEMKKDGSIYPGAEGLDNDPARAQFAKGGIGMKYAYSFDVGVLNDQFPAEIEWGVAPEPVLDENKRYKQGMDYGRTFYISKRAKDTVGVEAIETVLRFFLSDEFIRETYSAGIDMPIDWNVVSDIPTDNLPDGWSEFAKITEISRLIPPGPSRSTTITNGVPSINQYFLSDIWTQSGKESVKDTLKRYTDMYNEAVKVYCQEHPEYNRDGFKDAEWIKNGIIN